MIVTGGLPANFNYVAFNGQSGLFVAGSVYDVTTGTPALVGGPTAMTDLEDGSYFGSFMPAMGHYYLVITAVYLDSGFTMPDVTWAPSCDNYDAPYFDTSLINFNYVAYDQGPSLTINTVIYDLTDSTQSSLVMAYVALGVYFGQYQGVIGKSYAVVSQPTDSGRAASGQSFQCFSLSAPMGFQMIAGTLVGQSLNGTLIGQSLNAILVEN